MMVISLPNDDCVILIPKPSALPIAFLHELISKFEKVPRR